MAKQHPSKNKPARQKVVVPQPVVAAPILTSTHTPWWMNKTYHILFTALTALLLYANTIGHEYTQDDAIVIQENMFTQKGIEGIPGILKYDTFFGFFKEEGKANLVAGGRYRPFTLILFAVYWEFFGDNPIFFHLMNVLWFALTCVVLYLLFSIMLQPLVEQKQARFLAFATTLLFTTHPIHVEAVANIKGLDEIMTLLGSIGALYFAFRATDEKKGLLLIPVFLLFLVGLFSKENAITFLGVAPLSFFIFRSKQFSRFLPPLLTLGMASLVFLIIRFSIIKAEFDEPALELMNNPFLKLVGNEWQKFSFEEWSATVMFTLGKYIQLLFFPHPLTHDYYPRHVAMMNWSDISVLISAIGYVSMTIFALIRLPKKDFLSYAILLYLMTLSIVSNVVFPIGTNMGERFLFMPSVGFCFLVSVLLWRGSQWLTKNKTNELHPVITVVFGVLIVLFSFKTITRNTVWKDNFTLFTTDINVSHQSAKLRNGTAGVLLEQAVKEKDAITQRNMFLEAKGHLLEAIKIHPTYKNAYLLLGNTNNYLKLYDESVNAYQQALALDGGYEEARSNLTITYRDAGQYYGEQQNDVVKSIAYLEAGNQFAPNNPEILRLLGIAYGISNRVTDAINVLEQAAKIAPNQAGILYNLGAAYGQLGDAAKAQSMFEQAKAIDPSIATKTLRNEA
nr:tetratricopeptide repeat protein [Desulfobacula sp.]